MQYFSELPIRDEIKKAIQEMGFSEMTEIQRLAIPVLLGGREVIAKAPTGTGKTCAFGIPLIERLDLSQKHTQAVILCPTRELCTQIAEELRALVQFLPEIKITAVYGGQPMGPQISALKTCSQIVVATPGRLLDHMSHRSVNLSRVKTAVLDEADEMLDMGFLRDVRRILDALPAREHVSMFSATISREVMDVGWMYQHDAEELTVLPVEENRPLITQYSLLTTGRQKIIDMQWILYRQNFERALVFCNTKYTTASVCETLKAQGYNADCIHGDMLQKARNHIMAAFKQGNLSILVATDVAARGIDVADIDAVINYDMPQDNETYVHRIGRTARAKKRGVSFLLYTRDELPRLKNILRYTKYDIQPIALDAEGNIRPDAPAR